MLRVDSPYNLGIIHAAIRKIITFDFETGDLQKAIWGFEREERLNYWFEVSGYDSNIIMFTLGLEFYVFWGLIITLIVLWIAKYFLTARYYYMVIEWQEKYIYNALLLFFYEAALEITVCVMMGIWNFDEGTDKIDDANRVFIVFFAIGFVAFIVWLVLFLLLPNTRLCSCTKNYKNVSERLDYNMYRTGSIYRDIKFR
jgi:hypothetical protein